MLDQQILDEALSKKNKEFENLKTQYNEMKRTYETKIKNLMNSISTIKSEKDMIENNNKDNKPIELNQILCKRKLNITLKRETISYFLLVIKNVFASLMI